MKLGILTFHRGINAGGFLQARGLSSFLSSLGHQVELIDYMNEAQRVAEHQGIFRTRHPLRRWNNIRKLRRYEAAFESLPFSARVATSGEIAACGYDGVVFGSDEIWNVCNRYCGGDLTFFGSGLTGVKKVSYAPSFGSTPIGHDSLPGLAPLLKDFERITVRDQHSAEIVETITGKMPPLVVDPVLLSGRDEPFESRKTRGAIGLYLMAPRPCDVARIKTFAKSRRQKTCSMGYYYSWADHNVAGLMPQDIPGWLAGCRLVITNTFHGVVFCLKNEIPFIIIDHPAKNRKLNTLRERLGLETVYDADAVIEDRHLNGIDENDSLMGAWVGESKQILRSMLDGIRQSG